MPGAAVSARHMAQLPPWAGEVFCELFSHSDASYVAWELGATQAGSHDNFLESVLPDEEKETDSTEVHAGASGISRAVGLARGKLAEGCHDNFVT